MNHWFSLLPGDGSQATMDKLHKAAPAIKGFLKRYQHKLVEPEKDLYDLRPIEADRAWCAERNLALIPMIEDKTFVMVNPCPTYARAELNGTGGYTAVRWDPETKAGFLSLLAAVAHRFSGRKGFAGIASQETALGLSGAILDSTGYTAAKYADYYLEMDDVTMMADCPMWFHANFMPRGQDQIERVLDSSNPTLRLGGPDCWPRSDSLVRMMYPYYADFPRNFIGMTRESYENYTGEELVKFATETLKVQDIFWQHISNATLAKALPFIKP